MPDLSAIDARREAVANGLLPIMRIEGQPLHWSMAERQDHYQCPGVSVAVIKGGEIDWAAGFGTKSLKGLPGGDEPIDSDTMFMAASCSKPITAVLALQQVDRGVFDLDADINRYLTRWQIPVDEFTSRQPVTLRHILSHTAGLTVNGWGAMQRDSAHIPTVIDLLEGKHPSVNQAVYVDKHYDGVGRYSGGGYVLTQMALEDTLGESFDSLAQRMLFDPLGMTRSNFTQPLPEKFHTNVASGHNDVKGAIPGGWMVQSDMGAGGLFSTAGDYARFLIAVRRAWLGEMNSILSHETARGMLQRHASSVFGLGFRVLGSGSHARMNHGGSNDGFQSETDLYLESGDGAVVFTNSVSGIYLFKEVLNGISQVYDWPGYMIPPKKLVTLTPEQQQKYVGSYRIQAGIELPLINVWVQNGQLTSEIPGLRFGVQPAYCDSNGLLFNQTGPYETHVEFGDDGRARNLIVIEGGETEIMRAERVA